MRNQHQHTWKIRISKLSPQTLIEPGDAIIRISRTLSIRNPIKEMTIRRPLMPHPRHLIRARLEISKILLSEAWFFIDFDFVEVWVRAERGEHSFGGLASAHVGAGVELDGVGGGEHVEEVLAGFFGLGMAGFRELYAVVGDGLVDCPVLVAFGLGMADEDDELGMLELRFPSE